MNDMIDWYKKIFRELYKTLYKNKIKTIIQLDEKRRVFVSDI